MIGVPLHHGFFRLLVLGLLTEGVVVRVFQVSSAIGQTGLLSAGLRALYERGLTFAPPDYSQPLPWWVVPAINAILTIVHLTVGVALLGRASGRVDGRVLALLLGLGFFRFPSWIVPGGVSDLGHFYFLCVMTVSLFALASFLRFVSLFPYPLTAEALFKAAGQPAPPAIPVRVHPTGEHNPFRANRLRSLVTHLRGLLFEVRMRTRWGFQRLPVAMLGERAPFAVAAIGAGSWAVLLFPRRNPLLLDTHLFIVEIAAALLNSLLGAPFPPLTLHGAAVVMLKLGWLPLGLSFGYVAPLALFFGLFCIPLLAVLAVFFLLKGMARADRVRRRQVSWLFLGCALLALKGPIGWTIHAVTDVNQYRLLATELVHLCSLVALGVGVFFQGALDPRIALRKTVLLSILGLGLVALLVSMQSGVSLLLASSVGGRDVSIAFWVAVSGSFLILSPAFRSVERRVGQLVDRLVPATALIEDAERKEIAVLCADLSSYTTSMATNVSVALMQAYLFHDAADRVARQGSGRLVKTTGDGVLLEFATPSAAVLAARRLMVVYPSNCRTQGTPPLGVRIGIHCGEVVLARDGDVFGEPVNVADRLQAVARPGEVVLSDSIRQHLEPSDCSGMRCWGEVKLKNLPQVVVCYSESSHDRVGPGAVFSMPSTS